MKYKTIVALILMVSPAALLAAQKNSGSVTFSETVTINGTAVPPGDYRVEWQGTGSSVQASIIRAGKVVASSPATIVPGKTELGDGFETRNGENNSHVLNAIDWAKLSLRFDQAKVGTTNTAE
jgi:hypothetical protein